MPELLMDVTVQPIMFVLLFAFVFGSSISVPGASYKEFLIPGIMAQTACFSTFVVALGLVNDLDKGFVDRLKSLPIPRSSLLVGRSISSLIHSTIGFSMMALTGLLIGWRIRNGIGDALIAVAILLLFEFAMIWIGVWMGSILRSPEAVQGFGFTIMFPLTFLANTFAPTASMPAWLRALCEWNPVSSLTQALRHLWGNDHGVQLAAGSHWPLHHAVFATIAWSILIIVVMAPVSLRAFWKRSRD